MTIDDIKKLDSAVTHNGSFHADDVFSAAFLLLINPNLKFLRVADVDDNNCFAFDIGYGEFDHHQADNEKRSNGMPYASFGKLWKKFAPELYSLDLVKNVDERFIQYLDLTDNTGSFNQLSFAIGSFNPPFDSDSNGDKEFLKAVLIAKDILKNVILQEQKRLEAVDILKQKYNESEDKRIIVLDRYMPFKSYLPNTDVVYVIYPSKRGGYSAHAVTKSVDVIDLKVPFPSSWLINKPSYIRFCHNSLFLITTDSIEDAIKACNISLEVSDYDR